MKRILVLVVIGVAVLAGTAEAQFRSLKGFSRELQGALNRDGQEKMRRAAAEREAAAKLAPKEILRLLTEGGEAERRQAITAISLLPTEKAAAFLPELVKLRKSPEASNPKFWAALGNCGDEAEPYVVAGLKQASRDKNGRLAAAICQALIQMGADTAEAKAAIRAMPKQWAQLSNATLAELKAERKRWESTR